MIGRILNIIGPAFVYACVATVLAQLLGLGLLVATGMVSRDKLVKFMAVAYELDLEELARQDEFLIDGEDREDAALNRIIEQRALKNLDLDLRQQSIDKGLDSLLALRTDLTSDRQRYDDLAVERLDSILAGASPVRDSKGASHVCSTLMLSRPLRRFDQLAGDVPVQDALHE